MCEFPSDDGARGDNKEIRGREIKRECEKKTIRGEGKSEPTFIGDLIEGEWRTW